MGNQSSGREEACSADLLPVQRIDESELKGGDHFLTARKDEQGIDICLSLSFSRYNKISRSRLDSGVEKI